MLTESKREELGRVAYQAFHDSLGGGSVDDSWRASAEAVWNKAVEELNRQHQSQVGATINQPRCAKCHGQGSIPRPAQGDYIDCPACDGKGF